MPEISRFLGIIIYFAYNDHNPPHFHARYGEFDITVEIGSGIVNGKFPRRAITLVLEWYQQHKAELQTNWELARKREPLNSIEPLE
jgi:Domain of unknown function (DUF4160)